MKIAFKILAGLALLFAPVVAFLVAPLPDPPLVGKRGNYAIEGVHVVDVESGTILHNATILTRQDRIEAVLSSEDAGPGGSFESISARGKFAIPGLWDMHSHGLKISPQLHHALFIANGVTGARDMSGCLDREDSYWACPEDRKRWNREAAQGSRVAPRHIQQSSYQTNGGSEVPAGYPEFFRLGDREAAEKLVNFYVDENVDFIKTYTELTPSQYRDLARAAAARGLALAGHKPLSVSLDAALAAGQQSIEHGRLFLFECFAGIEDFRQLENPIAHYNPSFMRRLLEERDDHKCGQAMADMAAAGTWWTPTLTTLRMGALAVDPAFRSDPRLQTVPFAMRTLIWNPDADRAAELGFDEAANFVHVEFFEQAKADVRRARDLGVRLLAGTDNIDSFVYTGSGLHDELSMLVDAGLTSAEALRSATLDPAIFTGLEADFGSISAGKRADLLLLDGNPLQDVDHLRDIHAVFYNGAHYDRAALDQLRAYTREQAESIRVNLHFLWNALASPLMRQQLAD